ncbi:hypothetical protein BTA51_11860 [Hahella sp. CCB-MM4]|nr:hypothetical protein BTA51_11860 [Hahella sp. CCB-MM4]
MTGWYRKNLGDALLADVALSEIQTKACDMLQQTQSQEEAPVYYRHESEGRLHCELIVYFSPAAEQLARAFEAIPCSPPSLSGMSRLETVSKR